MKSLVMIIRLSMPPLVASISLGTTASAQVSEDWVAHYNGENNDADYARDIEIDDAGNIYATGTSMSAGNGADIVTVSFAPDGGERWVARFNGDDSLDDWGYSIARDSAGYLYVCGSSQSHGTGSDFVVIKYDNQGSQMWVRYYNGPGNGDDAAIQVEADCEGNVAATGTSYSSLGNSDYATVKYDSVGDLIWSARYDGPAGSVDEARALAVDCDGNVFVSGGSTGDSTGFDYATIKYDSGGSELWVARYDGPAHGYDVVFYAGSIKLDDAGGVFVTGYSEGPDSSYDYLTIKYDPSGNTVWAVRYDGFQGNDYSDALYIDHSGNAYVTGASYDSLSGYDFLTVKYNSLGVLQWTARYNGDGDGWDEAYGVAVDSEGDVYVAGRSVGDNTLADFATVKYSPSGNELWNIRYDGTAHNFDWPFRLLLDSLSNIYVAGWSIENGHSSDFTMIKYEQSPSGVYDFDDSPSRYILLKQNYPNPFNASTEINYYLPEAGYIRLVIYNVLGQKLATLVENELESGYHHVIWNGEDVTSGVYFYKLEAKNATFSRSMILLR